jgi:hypothetical protein
VSAGDGIELVAKAKTVLRGVEREYSGRKGKSQ